MAKVTTEEITTKRVTISLDKAESAEFLRIQNCSDLLTATNMDDVLTEVSSPSRYTMECRKEAAILYRFFYNIINNVR